MSDRAVITESHPSFRVERKVLLAVFAVLALIEIGLRVIEPRLSGNVRHIQELPQVAQQVKTSSAPSFLFLGNSLTANAVDPGTFSSTLTAHGVHPGVVVKAVPDATTIWDWYFLTKKYFFRDGAAPTTIVSGFAWGLLADQRGPNPSRLAAFFAETGDLPELVNLGMGDVGHIAEFGVARAFRTYADRDVIRSRLLDVIIPNYRRYAQEMNASARAGGATSARGGAASQSYRILHSLAEAARASNTRLVFIAMPVVDAYTLDPDLLTTAKSLGIEVLDYRQLPFVNEKSFLDPIHLGPDAGRQFSAYLADDFVRHGWSTGTALAQTNAANRAP